jgi:DNA-binding beta-propeller fold protein YncE
VDHFVVLGEAHLRRILRAYARYYKLTVIDPKSDSSIATIDVGGKLESAVAGDNGKLYVNGEEKKEIVRFDTATNQVDAHWPVPSCTSPHGLAIDPAMHRLFSSCKNDVLVVVDADTGATICDVTDWRTVRCGCLRS